MKRMVLTTDAPMDGDIPVDERGTRRCKGCAKCMYESPGTCILEDSFSGIIPEILSSDELELHSALDGHWFAMPMRKAVERIGNVLEAWTESGNNEPRDPSEITIRHIVVVVPGPEDAMFETSAREVLQKGPVSITFRYG